MTPPTPREAAVLRCLAAGLTKGESAVALGVSESAVRYHVTNLHAKAGTYTLARLPPAPSPPGG